MREINGEMVEEAVALCVETLRQSIGQDWTAVPARGLEWDCRKTAFHIGEDLIAYAGQLAGRARDAYVPFEIVPEEDIDNAGVVQVIETTGALFAATLRSTPREVRAFHPYPFRSANREGFAAMGMAEVLVHTYDIAEGLGLAYQPPSALAEFVVTRIFPHVRPDSDPWHTLLYAAGRIALPDRPQLADWRWNNNLVLRTDRLTLEGVTPAAAADLTAGGDGGFDWVVGGPYSGTREASGMVLKAYEGGVHRPEFGLFVLVREDGLAVGGMGFHGAPDEEGRAEVGYDLVEGARGRGYATEALRALSDWALARDDVDSLFATIERDNLPSQAVVSRAGYKRVGEDEEGLAFELRG